MIVIDKDLPVENLDGYFSFKEVRTYNLTINTETLLLHIEKAK